MPGQVGVPAPQAQLSPVSKSSSKIGASDPLASVAPQRIRTKPVKMATGLQEEPVTKSVSHRIVVRLPGAFALGPPFGRSGEAIDPRSVRRERRLPQRLEAGSFEIVAVEQVVGVERDEPAVVGVDDVDAALLHRA